MSQQFRLALYSDLNISFTNNNVLALDAEAVLNAVSNILNTDYGERDLGFFPEFGSGYKDQLHQPLDEEMAFEVMYGLQYAVQRFEPRIELLVQQSTTELLFDEGTLKATIVYRVKGIPGIQFYTMFLNRYHDLIRGPR